MSGKEIARGLVSHLVQILEILYFQFLNNCNIQGFEVYTIAPAKLCDIPLIPNILELSFGKRGAVQTF